MSPEFQSLVKEPESGFSPSKFLFGDDLSSKIKNLSEENKLICKTTVPRKQLPQKFKPQYRATQQSAKNSNRFSNRRVVFKQGNFRNKSKMPAESRQKPLSFNRTERNEPFSINWKNIVLSKKLGSTYCRHVCSGHCKRLQTTVQSPSTSILPSHNKPKIQQRVSSHNTRSEFSSLERCNKAHSQVSSKICVPSVHCSQKLGGLRPVINLKPLNQFLHLQTYKMEGLSNLKVILEPNDFMITIDLSDAYMTLPIEEESRNYLCFQFQDQMLQFCVLPFGLNDAPRAFTKTLKPPVGTLRSLGFKILVYLNDIILAASTRELCIYQGQILIKTLENLGFVINLQKSNLVPSQVVLFLGFIVDSKKMSFSLPDSKIQLISLSAQTLLNQPKVSFRKLSQFIGMCDTPELRGENMSKQSVKKRFDLVGKTIENKLFKTNPPSTSGSFSHVRCLRSSLGSSPRICKNSGFWRSYQLSWHINRKELKACSCSTLHRQQNSSCLHKPFRGHKVSGITLHCSENVGVVSGEEHVPFGSICNSDNEQTYRFVVPSETGINRMDAKSQNFQTNSICLQDASSRHVGIHPKSPSYKVFLLDSGSTSCGNGCVLSKLEQRPPLHVSSLQSD